MFGSYLTVSQLLTPAFRLGLKEAHESRALAPDFSFVFGAEARSIERRLGPRLKSGESG